MVRHTPRAGQMTYLVFAKTTIELGTGYACRDHKVVCNPVLGHHGESFLLLTCIVIIA